MRTYLSQLFIMTSLCVGCTDDKDPLDGHTGTDSADASTSTTTSASTTSASTTNASTTSTTSTTSPSTTDPATSTTSTTSTTTGDPADPYEAARVLCVDTINMYRATLGLPPYQRWTDAETCSDGEAQSDGQTGTPHGAFGMCEEFAQNECPGWPAPAETSLPECLALMWAEGPGQDFNTHGHYINMSSEQYTKVACGFAEAADGLWMIQNFQ